MPLFSDSVVLAAGLTTAILLLLLCNSSNALLRTTLNSGRDLNEFITSSPNSFYASRNIRHRIKSYMAADGNNNFIGGNMENDENKMRFPYSADSSDRTFKNIAKYNWKYGLCAHKIVFEAEETIKKMRFCGDLLAFSTLDGRVFLIRLSTGEVIDNFFEHKCEVTALDFDGINLVAGAIDGSVSISRPNYSNRYITSSSSSTSSSPSSGGEIESIENIISDNEDDVSVSSKSSSSPNPIASSSSTSSSSYSSSSKQKEYSDSLYQYSDKTKNPLHSKRITGIKIIRGEKAKMITCGMDKKLICVDVNTGKIKYSVDLDGIPLCMGVEESGGYGVLGFLDGRVQFFSTGTGVKILEFVAHKKKVQSVFMEDMKTLLTGSVDGQIKRWDISGEGKKKETEIIKTVEKNDKKTKKITLIDEKSEKGDKNDVKEKNEKTDEKSGSKEKKEKVEKVEEIEKSYPKRRFLDFYFEDAIKAEIMRKNSVDSGPGKTVPVNGKIKSGNAGKGSREPMVAKVTNALSEVPVEGCVTYEDADQTSSVVALQGDSEKILAAYADGTVRAWDVLTRHNRYDLKGRSPYISCLQFDATRLLVDGTHAVVVLHDFSTTPLDGKSEDLEYLMSKPDESTGKEEPEKNKDFPDRDFDDGTPSSTT